MPDETEETEETADTASQPARAARRFLGRTPRFWVHLVLVLVLAGVAVGHQAVFWGWYIEDAAISFAFARNWAWGEGLVPFPGGERTEGFSNPTWVFLLMIGEVLGADSFDSSKVLQAVLSFLTVPLTYLLAREAVPDERSHAPLFAAGYLATAATYAIWGACGLENALFGFLLAAALLRSAVDIRTQSFPWAAPLWFLLAITRPEAILYCAVAGFLTMCFTVRHQGVKPTLYWLAAFFVPFGVYHAVRFSYFAYEFPQTYYGKMTLKEPKPFAWNTRGWRYVRNWSHELWTGYFLPIWFFGLVGSKGVRGWLTAGALLLAGMALLLPDILPIEPFPFAGYEVEIWGVASVPRPRWIAESRSYLLIAIALCMPLLALGGERGWQARILCWASAASIFFFAIYTLGDWMKAWRWMSLLQVPTAVLFGVGVGAIAGVLDRVLRNIDDVVPARTTTWLLWGLATMIGTAVVYSFGHRFVYGQWWLLAIVGGALAVAAIGHLADRAHVWTLGGWTVATLLLATAVIPNITHTKAQNGRPETGPFAIRSRVDFVTELRDTLDIEGRIVDIDVDQGAHLWWGRDTFAMMDIAGLIDIPLAQHRFERSFIHEYVFEEMRPHFAHVHGGWASNSRIPTHPEWRSDYLEIPGYPAGRTQFHIGNFIRRDLLMKPSYTGDHDRRVEFEGGIVLEGLEIPSEPSTARLGFFEIAVRDTVKRKKGEDVQMLLFASQGDELSATWNVPLTYGWFAASDWRPEEVYVGKHKLPIPKSMAPGTYDIGVLFVSPTQTVLGPTALPPGALVATEEANPILAVGEVRFAGALTVVDLDSLSTLAREDRLVALDQARKGRCEQAETAWYLSRKHRPADKRYTREHGPAVNRELATCWAWRAGEEPDNAVILLEKSRLADHRAPTYLAAKVPVADRLYAEGLVAREAEDWEAAYRAFSDTLRVDKTRSWARRYAEEARAFRLGIDDASLEEAERVKKKRIEESRQRQEDQKKKELEKVEKVEKVENKAPSQP